MEKGHSTAESAKGLPWHFTVDMTKEYHMIYVYMGKSYRILLKTWSLSQPTEAV